MLAIFSVLIHLSDTSRDIEGFETGSNQLIAAQY